MPRKSAARFPLWLHPTGQWCKKVKGKNYYFGTDRDAALARYVAERADIEAGQRHATPGGPRTPATVADVVNTFLTAKRARVASGELTGKMWSDYHHVCEDLIAEFGRDRPAADLGPADFGRLRARMTGRLGPNSLAKFVQAVRTVFIFGFEMGLLAVPVRYGGQFDKPPRRVLRLERQKGAAKLVGAAEARALIAAAGVQLKAMILLGLNCGFGQMDCSGLQRASLAAARPGWLCLVRQKTGIGRRCRLWPETVEALDAIDNGRPDPRDPADAGCVFLTKYGRRWVRYEDYGDARRGSRVDAVTREFKRAARLGGWRCRAGSTCSGTRSRPWPRGRGTR